MPNEKPIRVQNDPNHPDNCPCATWAQADPAAVRSMLMGNAHHVECPKFIRDVGAVAMIESLLRGIEYWASQEDGIPDELWVPYKLAYTVVHGFEPVSDVEIANAQRRPIVCA